jgi:hypothetical protein
MFEAKMKEGILFGAQLIHLFEDNENKKKLNTKGSRAWEEFLKTLQNIPR